MLGTKRQLADDKRVAKPKRHDTTEDKKKLYKQTKNLRKDSKKPLKPSGAMSTCQQI